MWLIANTLLTNLKSAGAGLLLIALGLPLYFYFNRRSRLNSAIVPDDK